MKQTLVIGSTAVDVLLSVNRLPRRSHDVNIKKQTLSVGGCAYNTSEMLRLFNIPYTLCSPVGGGVYGNYIKRHFEKRGMQIFAYTPEIDNGCCYCIVENDGERTFLAHHGAEYLFHKSWMDKIDISTVDSVYISGLELEEETGVEIVEFLEEHPGLTIYFACGPRIENIKPELVNRIFALHPILHLNEIEALEYTQSSTYEQAAVRLNARTDNDVIVTLSKDGAHCFASGRGHLLPGYPIKPINSVGSGDSHIGTIIASVKLGYSLPDAITRANKVASKVTGVESSTLNDDIFKTITF